MSIVINIKLFVVLILILLGSIVLFIYKTKNSIKEDIITKQKNSKIQNENISLEQDKIKLTNEIKDLNIKINKELDRTSNLLSTMSDDISNQRKGMEEEAKKAFDRYCEILDQNYIQKELEYDNLIKILEQSYNKRQDELKEQSEIVLKELEKLRSAREATIAAQIKEQEIKEQLDFYKLNPSLADLNDIEILNTIKPKLSKPRILSMLIWSTYFQKEMTNLCNNILGTKTITGIYKITNQQTNKCYIGQSVDVGKRWKDHAKCGLDIDTPAGNKLYKDMLDIGIWNFSWELLEKCSKEELNERERYYIELYQSKDYGYNATKGVK
jgi:hypothetical protein